jgi:hypothetical protein
MGILRQLEYRGSTPILRKGVDRHGSFYEEVLMKRKLLSPNCILAVVVLILSGCHHAGQISRNTTASRDNLITVLNPAVPDKLAARVPLAPRLDALENKTIYLVDTNYEGMGRTPVLEEMRDWFAKNKPNVKIVFKLKSGNYAADDPALWKEIASNKANGVIIGVAG